MSNEVSTLLEAAMKLSDAQRTELAEALLETVPSAEEEIVDDELKAELDRRWREFEKDPSMAVPWSEVKRMTE